MSDGETLIATAIRTRPMVMLSKRQLREKIEDAIGVLKNANTPEPAIFGRESVLRGSFQMVWLRRWKPSIRIHYWRVLPTGSS